jgi:anti-sigma regulatory factor (Ser/Thr protein kinase)
MGGGRRQVSDVIGEPRLPASPREVELTRDLTAPGAARGWVTHHFGAELSEDTLATAKLLLSELVSNAVLHGEGAITLRALLEGDRFFAEVIDEGHGFSWTPPRPAPDPIGGWGLTVVAGESERWGIYEGTTHVWFELKL